MDPLKTFAERSSGKKFIADGLPKPVWIGALIVWIVLALGLLLAAPVLLDLMDEDLRRRSASTWREHYKTAEWRLISPHMGFCLWVGGVWLAGLGFVLYAAWTSAKRLRNWEAAAGAASPPRL